jgi:hypothetical protein
VVVRAGVAAMIGVGDAVRTAVGVGVGVLVRRGVGEGLAVPASAAVAVPGLAWAAAAPVAP